MQQREYTKEEILKESLWITIAWEWVQKLLGRAVDAVLWVTMIFAGYQLIPGAPKPYEIVSIFMFVAQFIALDIGGLALNQMAKSQGLPKLSFSRIVAYILIGITLVTIAFNGIEHAIPTLDAGVITVVEVILVIARSVMTVFYNQAIHALKAEAHKEQERIAELEQEVSSAKAELDTRIAEVDTLRAQLDREVSTLRVQLDTRTDEVDTLRTQLNREVSSLKAEMDREVSRLMAEVDTLTVQLENKDYQLTSLKGTMANGLKWHESNTEAVVSSVQSQLDSERERVSSLQAQVSSLTAEVDTERAKVSSLHVQLDREVSTLRVQLDTKTAEVDSLSVQLKKEVSNSTIKVDREVSSVKSQLSSAKAEVNTVRVQLDRTTTEVNTLRAQLKNATTEVNTLRTQLEAKETNETESEDATKVIQLDASRPKKSGQDEQAIEEQIRALLKAEPGLLGRAIARRIGCSPTTASKWKELIENERKEA